MSDASPGLLASLRGLATTSVALVRTRLELLKVEAQEEVGRISGLLLWGATAVLCGVLGVAFLGVFLTVLLWDSHRVLALGIFTALFLVAAAIAGSVTLRLLRQGSRLFAASLAELERDETALRNEDAAQ
ncbi:phage holin family protein [Sulfuricystis multivorans]|uniref:phage holin family protein n=1 Tax=Sulfuricystis multivorans TaxID=2211108 RepID=UPI000F84C8A8|nr:phage holin family protein [Sulfuricystis multivorans]